MNKVYDITSGALKPIWLDKIEPLFYKPLTENFSTDVAIVGAGISGLTTAYLLARAGKNVAVFEDGAIGSGETGRTTAHATCMLDDMFSELLKIHGKKNTRLLFESHKEAINKIEDIVFAEKIDCDFKRVNGYLFLSEKDKISTLKKEMKTFDELEISDFSFHAKGKTPFTEGTPYILVPNQARFHVMKYLKGLAEAIIKHGGKIFTETRISHFKKNELTTLSGKKIKAKFVVVATNSPVHDRFKIHSKQVPVRSFVIGVKIKKASLEDALYWDTGDPAGGLINAYHYIRLQEFDKNHDILIVGGEDQRTGEIIDSSAAFHNLEKWTKKYVKFTEVVYRWSGQVMEPLDKIAFIGSFATEKDTYLITGDSGNGITHGTIGGILVSDLILGHKNPWKELYKPSRQPLKNLKEFAENSFDLAKEYTKLLTGGETEITDLQPNEGKIIRQGLKKIAVYKDEKGKVHKFSAICPHLGCVISWNNTEKSFDCPCHGSRYAPSGDVINGPANKGLNKFH